MICLMYAALIISGRPSEIRAPVYSCLTISLLFIDRSAHILISIPTPMTCSLSIDKYSRDLTSFLRMTMNPRNLLSDQLSVRLITSAVPSPRISTVRSLQTQSICKRRTEKGPTETALDSSKERQSLDKHSTNSLLCLQRLRRDKFEGDKIDKGKR